MNESGPSLYEMLLQNFHGELALHQVSETHQRVVSVLDNIRRILGTRAGTLSHLPDYGLPDMGLILQGLPATAHGLMATMRSTLLRYEPRLSGVSVSLLPQTVPGHLEYALEVELKGGEHATFGTTLGPQGTVWVRHLKRQT